ncbi:hypothetical protein AGLY_003147 [Aphis glycines]|uniref:Uncharacterized protein n=1 Tax=Aphis glycines TaxID=307491 RepID=A0A6G0U4T7_APHGL|nr:hypothetical protein AGLY_003147 [Aphis glycines]
MLYLFYLYVRMQIFMKIYTPQEKKKQYTYKTTCLRLDCHYYVIIHWYMYTIHSTGRRQTTIGINFTLIVLSCIRKNLITTLYILYYIIYYVIWFTSESLFKNLLNTINYTRASVDNNDNNNNICFIILTHNKHILIYLYFLFKFKSKKKKKTMNDNSIFTYNNNNTLCKINTMYINEEKRGRAIRWCLYHFYHLNPTSHFPLNNILKCKDIHYIVMFIHIYIYINIFFFNTNVKCMTYYMYQVDYGTVPIYCSQVNRYNDVKKF